AAALAEFIASLGVSETEAPQLLAEAFERLGWSKPFSEPRASLQLPEEAPELYAARPIREELGRRENIEEFMVRVWGGYMDRQNGPLTRSALRKLDSRADAAIEQWMARHHELPKEVYLPTKQEINDALLQGPNAPSRQFMRLASAAYRRRKGAKLS